jgi:folate-binding protein YgfZ
MYHSPNAETLLLEGPDAGAFAQAQFSSAVDTLAVGQWQFSAWLDAKGRVRTFFHLVRLEQERYLLLLRGGDATAMAEALSRFVFRSRLDVTPLPTRALTTGTAQPMNVVTENGDVFSLGCGNHSLDVAAQPGSDNAWRLLQLRNGWPWLPTSALDALLPAALSLQRLHAVAVDKGCYPGQEIVARLHFRGGNKQHLYRGTLSQLLPAGQLLHIDGQEVGRVLDVVASDDHIEALVMLSENRVSQDTVEVMRTFDDHTTMQIQASWPA